MNGDKLLDYLEGLDPLLVQESYLPIRDYHRKRRSISMKKIWMVALVAVMIMGFALTVGAAVNGALPVSLLQFMGLNEGASRQLKDGTVQIGVQDTSMGTEYLEQTEGKLKEVTMTASESVGDDRAVYIRIDTDYQVPEGFDESQDYFQVENYSIEVENTWWQKLTGDRISYSSMLSAQVENGKVYFLIAIDDVKNMNTSRIFIHMENLKFCQNQNGEDVKENVVTEQLAYVGEWDLSWTYSYQTNSKRYQINETLDYDQNNVTLTKVEVTPLGVHVKGKGDALAPVSIEVNGIVMRDGRIIETKPSGGGRSSNGVTSTLNGYVVVEDIGEVLDPDEVYSVIVGDQEIVLK